MTARVLQTVLRVSADFSDAFNSEKTLAVHNLLASCESFRHLVFALNRRAVCFPDNIRVHVAVRPRSSPVILNAWVFLQSIAPRACTPTTHDPRSPVVRLIRRTRFMDIHDGFIGGVDYIRRVCLCRRTTVAARCDARHESAVW